MQICKRPWGKIRGREVHLFDVTMGDTRLSVSDFGALWQAFVIGEQDFVLGYDTPQEYAQKLSFYGAMIGPIADRMAEGRCVVNGQSVQLEKNAGPDSMHSSNIGFHHRIWDAEELSDGVRFFTVYKNEGLPGRICISLSYRLMDAGCVRLEYAASSDTETTLNFTNHSFFNLHGGKASCADHRISVYADRYAETTRETDPIVTGRALPVYNTPMDLRKGAVLGDVLAHREFSEIRTGDGLDHFFVVDGEGMRPHAVLETNAWRLECASDAPGVLVYSGNGIDADVGKGGAIYGKNYAVCLETECFPNAVNLKSLRKDALFAPGERYATATEFRLIKK